MKVTISVGGRFHAFHLASQLAKRDCLEKLITAYPKFVAVKADVPGRRVVSIPFKEILERAWSKLPSSLRRVWNPQFFLAELFDKQATKRISATDVFVGWSSFSLHAIERAKMSGALTVLDHGSSHIAYQDSILREEYMRLGLIPEPYGLAHPKIIEKELREYEEADYIAIPSSFVRRTFLAHGIPESKIIQIPYGVDISLFRQLPKEDGIFRIIFRANLTLRKGLQYLLKAFHALRLPKAELLLIGTVSEEIKPILREYSGMYRLIPNQTMSRLPYYYSQGSIFVFPSIEEGLGMVQPQAMACGLPVICTINTGGEDIVRDGIDGFIIPIRDVEALKEKILYFYENPEMRARMGQSAKERVSSGFTWDDYGRKMISAYENILAGKNQR